MQAQQYKDLIQESMSDTLEQLDNEKKENDLISQLFQQCADKDEQIANLKSDMIKLQSD